MDLMGLPRAKTANDRLLRWISGSLPAAMLLAATIPALAAPGKRPAKKTGKPVPMAAKQPSTSRNPGPAPSPAAVTPSYRYDVLPILSRNGCNQGTCHGNSEGRGGLKLSLKGEDPEGDALILARHGGGRRINRVEPGRSLLLLKATSAVPHGGGVRFNTTSAEYRTLAAWIAAGAPVAPPAEPTLVRLEVSPGDRILIEPQRTVRLSVRARFSDGSTRDVARLAYYNTGDPKLEVSPEGVVTARRPTDATVLVRYADQMENVRITLVPARKEFVWTAPPVFNWIDEINDRRLKLLRLRPSRLTTDTEFVRRAYLDTLGRLPRPEEVRAFLKECDAERLPSVSNKAHGSRGAGGKGEGKARARLVDDLLERPEFDDYWTLKWSDVLRLEERSLDPKGGVAYRDWIRTSLAQKKPLDQFARELLTASGSTYANPAANYYRRSRNPIDLAEGTAQVFMGARLLCAKCHNHPFERWKQDDFYAFAAFFARVERKGEFTRRDRFDKHELNGEEVIGVAVKGEVEHPRTGQAVPARLLSPAIPQPASIQPDATRTEDRRLPFAQWLTAPENPFFARAMVNRIWFHVMGKGLVDPVDDMRASNPPSNPELFEALTKDFVAHGFDLRHLVRTIMNSRTYQLSSEPNVTNAEDERYFSRAIVQRLPAEVLLDAVSDVTGVPESFAGQPKGTRAIQLPPPPTKGRHAFLRLFGQHQRESVCECERTNEPTLGQSFALVAGPVIEERVRKPENRLGKLLAAGSPDPEIITQLYLAALSRPPTTEDLSSAQAYIASRTDRRAAYEDLLWALLNSKEFLLRR